MNENHPIEGLMKSAMNSIKEMVDVNTIIGEPIKTSDNTIIIPVSKVSFGFAAGGSEFNMGTLEEHKRKDKDEEAKYKLPFGGGSGAAVTISPVAFAVISQDMVRILPIDHFSALDKIVDYIPDLLKQAKCIIDKNFNSKLKNQNEKDSAKLVNKKNKKIETNEVKEILEDE